MNFSGVNFFKSRANIDENSGIGGKLRFFSKFENNVFTPV